MTLVFQNWLALLAGVLATAIACLPAELLVRSERHSWTSRARSILFWAIMLWVYAAVLVAAQLLIRGAGLKPLFTVDLTALGTGTHWLFHLALSIVLTCIPAFMFDFCYYWFHRLQHSIPILWRLHSVHHAIEELNATNCHHHWTEGLLRIPLILVPLMLLVELRVPEILVIAKMLTWGQVVHVTNALDFGPFEGYSSVRVFIASTTRSTPPISIATSPACSRSSMLPSEPPIFLPATSGRNRTRWEA